ncbi:MAG: glycosyltransferase family 39 protein [Anaerolineae bacterium]|nr:glycosyltransferase family 39 protein [Anaerolineae bacterium]
MAWTLRHERVVLPGVLVLALALRVLYMALFVGLDSPPTYDGRRYDYFAVHILAGEGYRTEFGPTASKPPLYPFFIAAVYRLFGPGNFVAVRLLQALIDSLSCILLFFLGKALKSASVGLLAAVGAAFYPLSIYMSALLYPETLFLFLLTACLLVSVKVARVGRCWAAGVCGILFGLSTLARPNTIVFLPFILVFPFFLQSRPQRAWRLVAVFLLAMVLTILPWSIRNYLVFREFVPLTTEGGGVFWADNHPLAEGGTVIPGRETWQGDDPPDRLWSGWSELGEPESSRRFFRAGLQWIRSHPIDFLALLPGKLGRLWSPASFTTHSQRRAGPLTTLLWIPYLPFLLLVAAGIVGSLGRWREWFLMYGLILSTNLTALVFAGGTRYLVPMSPALLVFCALGLSTVFLIVNGTFLGDDVRSPTPPA